MAQYGTHNIHYSTSIFLPAMKGGRGWLNILNQSARIGSARGGSLTVRITTAVTLQTPLDGTMLTNNAARTNVNLTAFRGVHTVALFADERDQYDGEADDNENAVFMDAAEQAAQLEAITDFVGGTPAFSFVLPVGAVDFAWTTDIMRQQALGKVDQAFAALLGNTKGKARDIFGVVSATGFGNLIGAIGQSGYGQFLSLDAGLDGDEPRLMWRGSYPIYIYAGTNVSGFSDGSTGNEVDEDALYWVHRDAEALSWVGAEVPHQDLQHQPDGLWKKYWHAFGFAGLIQGSHYTCVVNPSA